MDPSGAFGNINVSGSGEDAFGGDLAEASFTAYGYVEEIDASVGDCCEDNETGGCSNHYITKCVSILYDASCYTTAWTESCVEAVDDYECGSCP
jgi:hypothetical protein